VRLENHTRRNVNQEKKDKKMKRSFILYRREKREESDRKHKVITQGNLSPTEP